MKNQLLGICAVAMALWQTTPAQAAFLSWVPPSKEMRVGEIGYIDLFFSRTAGDSGPLGAFDVLLQFDPTVVRFDAAASSLTPAGRDSSGLLPNQLACPGLPTTCNYWGSLGNIVGQTDDDDGTIELMEISLAPSAELDLQAHSFLLMRLAFEGRALGTSGLDMLRLDLSDADGVALSLIGREPTARLSVTVPEPVSIGLVLTALFGCAGLSARSVRPRA